MKDAEDRIKLALYFAQKHGTVDGAHHKMWCIDQMVRALTGCPTNFVRTVAHTGMVYEYLEQGKSDEYVEWVVAFCDGADGPNTYEWDTGIAP